jgi:hypothetical protein
MGSILISMVAPTPLGDGADDGLAAGLHRDVLDPDHLLALATVPVESLDQGREGAHQLVGSFCIKVRNATQAVSGRGAFARVP